MTDLTLREPAVAGREDAQQLVLTPMCDRSWRLCDHGRTASDPVTPVAYIELLEDGTFQAVWVSFGLGSARYSSLDQIFLDAIERLAGCRSLGACKPDPIPHRPPVRA